MKKTYIHILYNQDIQDIFTGFSGCPPLQCIGSTMDSVHWLITYHRTSLEGNFTKFCSFCDKWLWQRRWWCRTCRCYLREVLQPAWRACASRSCRAFWGKYMDNTLWIFTYIVQYLSILVLSILMVMYTTNWRDFLESCLVSVKEQDVRCLWNPQHGSWW